MSKGSLFMGTARGKLGEVVMYRKDGEQISRVRVRKIGNPRSQAQMIQRTFMATVTKAYSHLSSIVDHSFESESGVMRNMSRFTKVNLDKFREAFTRANEQWANNARYNGKNEMQALFNEYIISEGTLPQMMTIHGDGDDYLTLQGSGNLTAAPTYNEIVNYLGLQRGDQITIVTIGRVEDNLSAMGELTRQRIILEPSSGDMTAPFLQAGKVNLPNSKNETLPSLTIAIQEGSIAIETGTELGGWAVIASRYEGKTWRRSNQVLNFNSNIPAAPTLGQAVMSWESAVTSSLYLNQAES